MISGIHNVMHMHLTQGLQIRGYGCMGTYQAEYLCLCYNYIYNNFADSLVEDPPDTNDSLVNHNDGPSEEDMRTFSELELSDDFLQLQYPHPSEGRVVDV